MSTTPPPPSYSSPIIPPTSSPSSSSHHKAYPQHPGFQQRKSSIIINIEDTPEENLGDSSILQEGENQTDNLPSASSIPNHMKSLPLSRTNSNSSSLAEEGELDTLLPLPSSDNAPSSSNQDPNVISSSSGSRKPDANESTGLISGKMKKKWYKGPYFVTAVKFSILFTIFTAVVVITFYFGMPKLDPEDKGVLKLPRSFADLQALNTLFQKYKTKHPFRILACAVVTYLFIQTFTLPGSMYISILFGAAYGIMYGLVLCCLCDAFGSLLCYTLSSLLAPPLLTMPFYRARVETWRTKIMGDPKKGKKVTWDSVFAFLLVLRIAPFPPHWVANFVAPHLGIGMFMFWSSCFIGIAPVSVIHVTIGSSLDSMTSAADFHLLSLRNILGLLAVVVAVLIPVGLKRVFKKDLGDLGEAEEILEENHHRDERDINIPYIEGSNLGGRRYHAIDSGVVLSLPSTGKNGSRNLGNKIIRNGKGKNTLEIIHDEDEEEDYDFEDDFYGYNDENGDFEYNIENALNDALQDQPNQNENENSNQAESSNTSGQNSQSSSSSSTPNQEDNNNNINQGQEEEQEDDHDQFQYQVYDPSGKIQTVEYNSTRTRSRSNSRLSGIPSRPKSYSRSNTNNTIRTYGTINEN
ncbi:uncharacterized protein L201_006650 [Kwoniella dendrophila CBS 6074]|uniref:Golgi apparatus membrane protein TVP38 n=1 Tax=Kwoniella dendrophila CBS 6074 TaxID=1295534 RepID=A0AAX4K3M2_9TREE